MIIRGKGVDFGNVCKIIARVSAEHYGSVIIPHADARALNPGTGYGYTGRIIGTRTGAYGTRTAASGRRGPWACWHAYRDTLAAIFAAYPHAVVTTAHARYVGAAGFDREYPRTARVNVGSEAVPARMPSLCACGEHDTAGREVALRAARERARSMAAHPAGKGRIADTYAVAKVLPFNRGTVDTRA